MVIEKYTVADGTGSLSICVSLLMLMTTKYPKGDSRHGDFIAFIQKVQQRVTLTKRVESCRP